MIFHGPPARLSSRPARRPMAGLAERRRHRWTAFISLVLLAATMAGCGPSGTGADDEEKDPNYWTGINRKRAMDYAGAIEAFERTLQNNPHSAPAHFELGLLYQKGGDWSSAIYHLDRFNRLRPKSNKADIVRQLIMFCKQELVKDVPVGALSQQMQRELEKLIATNKLLVQENDQLKLQWAQRAVAPPPRGDVPPKPLDNSTQDTSGSSPPGAAQPPAAGPVAHAADSRPAAAGQTHTVQSGDTIYGIARRYGVSANALLTANPTVNPRRLRVGQALNIPAR